MGELTVARGPALRAGQPAFVAALDFMGERPRHREQQHRFGARVGRHPPVRVRDGVGQPNVHHGDLGAGRLAVDDPLGVGIEVVACLQVGGEEEDELRVRVVGRGPVRAG